MVGQFVVLVDAYTAPELHCDYQDEGAATPTAASDVYSLGGVIHWVIRFLIYACTMITGFQICMGEHPSVSLSPTPLENAQPLIGKGPPSTARTSVPETCFVSQDHPTDTDSSTSSQHPSLHRDPSFHSLIQRTRSHNPSHRPNLLTIALQLQHTVARYFLCLSALPLPAPASLSASLSLYMPRTPVMTPSPIPIENFPESLASRAPSPSRPSEPSYPHHPHHSHTVNVDLISDTRINRPTRESRPKQFNHSQSPVSLDMFSEVASRANRLPLAPSQHLSAKRHSTQSPCNDALTLPPLYPPPLGA
jgi:hypothetical protein